ncbi:MAG: MEDS domain-containing protein [Magnetococcales bacterium]|nr:MEDS domain-containing protein [Magnetococcales bacterium]
MTVEDHREDVDLGFTAERFPPGQHMCLIYNDEEERRRVIGRFLQSGLEGEEFVAYFAQDAAPEEIRHQLQKLGVECARYEARNQLQLLSTHDAYFPEGAFTPEGMLERLRHFYHDNRARGWRHVRASGEMHWALSGVPGADRLFEYECRLNDLVRDHPLTPICQYDARRFSGAAIFAALQVHPLMIVQGQVVRNPYYVDVTAWLARWGGAFLSPMGQ